MSKATKPFKDRSYTIFAVDFDGVLCYDEWPKIGKPLERNIEYIKALRSFGNKVILWTCRTGLRLDHAVEWCRERGLEFDAVNENLPEVIAYYGDNPRKISADYYIDDRAFLIDFETDASGFDGPGCPPEPDSTIWSKTIDERIADGEIDPAYFFEGGQP